MGETKFNLHEDPEEVQKMEMQIDPNNKGYFTAQEWLDFMTHKNNHIEEDLIRAFKVFDTNDDKVVKRDELKSVFLNLIGKHIVTESQLDAMFNEAMEQTDAHGNIDYHTLTQIMLNEPDPLALPENIKL